MIVDNAPLFLTESLFTGDMESEDCGDFLIANKVTIRAYAALPNLKELIIKRRVGSATGRYTS